MNNNYHNTYTKPPHLSYTMTTQMAPPPRTWKERMMLNFGMGKRMSRIQALTIPNWLIGQSIAFFFVAMFACLGVYGYFPGTELLLAASISVILFFYGGLSISRSLARANEKKFIERVFLAGFIVRILWILYCYFVFNPEHYGNTYGDTADVDWYMPFAKEIASWMSGDSQFTLVQLLDRYTRAMDDMGYPIWLGVVYFFTGEFSDIFMPMLVKALVSSYSAIFIYRIAKRHFGEGVARLSSIFVCLNPNMIFWSASMMKESEMVFLCCLSLERFDRVLTSGKKYTFRALWPGVLAGLSLFFFRMALGLTFFIAVFTHILMTSNRVMSFSKKVLAGLLVFAILAVSLGDRIRTQSQELVEKAQSDEQKTNMEWRGEREGGNSFAKYAGAAVFAPLIFTIPFPTFNLPNDTQILQVELAGGSYIKNILSFFVIIVMLILLISGEWRRHVFILAYTVGYLMVLVMSSYAHSGRFHMPVWPMLMLFAAYGIQLAKGNAKLKRWFPMVLIIEVVACLAWNWFKLAGRGMV